MRQLVEMAFSSTLNQDIQIVSKMGNGEQDGEDAAPRGSAKFRLGRMTRITVPRHELDFISKVGRIDHAEALAMLQKNMGDREAVFSELMSRLKR